MIVGLVGFIGCGKNTTAEIIRDCCGYKMVSFAESLKDAVSCIFGWPREMMEGTTLESREFREKEDKWWSEKLGRRITPRIVLQQFGTEVIRESFHDDMWILSLLRKIMSDPNSNYVVSDMRFHNEINAFKNVNCKIYRVIRGPNPIWFDTALNNPNDMKTLYPSVHTSEYDWISCGNFDIIDNNGSVDDLKQNILNIMKDNT